MIDASTTPFIQDGSAWWHARESIDRLGKHAHRHGRTRVTGPADPTEDVDVINALLLCRDAIVDRLSDNGRAMLLLALRGATQAQIARELNVTEGAVSQQFSRGIAAVRDAQALLQDAAR